MERKNGIKNIISQSLIENLLPGVQKPGRYIGGEVNQVRKSPEQVCFRVALVFPDIYEIGMSYHGFQILYNILNKQDDIAAERVFAPWSDMSALLEDEKIPLFSLETYTPLSEFDIVGITLQYELHYPNILQILHLGKIPLKSSQRSDADPLVLGGGPCAFHPEPIADYFDAIVVGDGEEVVLEIVRCLKEMKYGKSSRYEKLCALASIPGIYIPQFYKPVYNTDGRYLYLEPKEAGIPEKIKARIIPELKSEHYSFIPIIPFIEVVHDRLSKEIMRGCTQGCRFCEAGYTYRPTREREPDKLIKEIITELEVTGYDEFAFTALSTTDYRELSYIMKSLDKPLQKAGICVSLASLRPDCFTYEMAKFVRRGRKTGLTLAIEAGTDRLRRVINKSISEEKILQSAHIAFKHGWQLIKLYFMIGLPTETMEDIIGITEITKKILREGHSTSRKKINLSIGPFVPRPFTPFQWERQHTTEELEEKIKLLQKNLNSRRIHLKWRDPQVSVLEGILARGDRRLAQVVYKMWARGCLFNGWTEQFQWKLWKHALRSEGINLDKMLAERNPEDGLPWDHIDKGIPKSYLLEDLRRAYTETTLEDCRYDQCTKCGVMGIDNCIINVLRKKKKRPLSVQSSAVDTNNGEKNKNVIGLVFKYRIYYEKNGLSVFISHRDLIRIYQRALRRSRFRLVYSRGFHPHPLMKFSLPLPVGHKGYNEFFDVCVSEKLDIPNAVNSLQNGLPEGILIKSIESIPIEEKAPAANINITEYRVKFNGISSELIDNNFRNFTLSRSLWTPVGNRVPQEKKDLRAFTSGYRYSPEENYADITLLYRGCESVRIEDIIKGIFPFSEQEVLHLQKIRLRMGHANENDGIVKWFTCKNRKS